MNDVLQKRGRKGIRRGIYEQYNSAGPKGKNGKMSGEQYY
jgi:hypothetical protein